MIVIVVRGYGKGDGVAVLAHVSVCALCTLEKV